MNEFDFQVRPLRSDEICQVYDIFLEEGGFCPPQYLMDMYSHYSQGFYGAVTDTGLVISKLL